MKVSNMISSAGNPVANQFIITDLIQSVFNEDYKHIEVFQSYDSVIVKRVTKLMVTTTYLDRNTWDYSTTTGKYRNQFLGETKKETQAKIDSGEYTLANLN